MVAVPGYALRERLHRGRRASVHRARALETNADVVLKVSPELTRDPSADRRFRHEYRIGSSLADEHVLDYSTLESVGEHLVIVEEDFGARALEDCLGAEPLDLELSLDIAWQVALGLAAIHARDVVHRAIHPGNILVDTHRRLAKITDFADAMVVSGEQDESAQELGEPSCPLAYVSPEQTGRTRWRVDRRSDLYSLGVVMYRMLSARLPFEDADPFALVHSHTARVPRPLIEVRSQTPRVVSDIVDKLLAKNPDDRYQSARGLAADLYRCLEQSRTRGVVEPFELGREDILERLVLPRRLYGRDVERGRLLQAFEHVAATGTNRMMIVSGYSGVGKSSLVHAVESPIADRGGFFVSGKLDFFHRNVPYGALRPALRQVCESLLTEPPERLDAWRERILTRLGVNAALVVDLVPTLARIIGPQRPPPDTGLVQSQYRFILAVQRFVGLLATRERPLVLFLDDMQWVDGATLQVLRALLTGPDIAHLFVVCAVRANEIDRSHPFAKLVGELRRAEVPIEELSVGDLGEPDVQELLAELLHTDCERVRQLSRVVHEKTSGNPFFVFEFTRTLQRERLLYPSVYGWSWDLGRISRLTMTANVVDLTVQRIARLGDDARQALVVGACIGDGFSSSLVARVLGRSVAWAGKSLQSCVAEGLLLPVGSSVEAWCSNPSGAQARDPRYLFAHDRIRQAAYELVDERERASLHLGIGRLLLAETPEPKLSPRIFDISDQLGRGAALIVDPAERLRVARLSLQAGEQDRSTPSFRRPRRRWRSPRKLSISWVS